MTDFKDTNGSAPDPHSDANGSGSSSDADWSEFEREHADELRDVAASRSAKRFERHIERQRKKALISVDDLDNGAFTDDIPSHGPRDFTHSSILDAPDDDFIPPDPHHGHPTASVAVFALLFVVGVTAVVASVFLPALTGSLATIGGVAAVIGAAGLIGAHRPHAPGRRHGDDGARV
ncbi:hypothetical protein [Bifidobacterium minimum]|uniref:hypothetical protein n=1 Tax=Bifidobacterium minimum TaxID=1693 RepID=UPI0003B7A6D7|nr:hypothetical protein [Bifidobacterium minimum]